MKQLDISDIRRRITKAQDALGDIENQITDWMDGHTGGENTPKSSDGSLHTQIKNLYKQVDNQSKGINDLYERSATTGRLLRRELDAIHRRLARLEAEPDTEDMLVNNVAGMMMDTIRVRNMSDGGTLRFTCMEMAGKAIKMIDEERRAK